MFYMQKYYCLDNFSSFAVEYKRYIWSTVEHAYQAQKFFGFPKITDQIKQARSAHEAKQIAKANKDKVRLDWPDIKLQIMEEILRAKLEQHPYVKNKLSETGIRKLIEDSPTDNFWGRGPDNHGQNHMGKIWMKLRAELQRTSVVC